jgi:hypothetical protein
VLGPHSGTYYVVADNPYGPYVPPPGEWLLLGNRDTTRLFGTYVGRPFRLDTGETLLYHHWTAAYPTGWWGPPKRLVERGPYQLGLDYWPGCEALKGDVLSRGPLSETISGLPAAGRVPVIEWTADADTLHATNQGGLHGVSWWADGGRPSESYTDLSNGRVLEVGIRIREGRSLGIWIGRANEPSLAIFFNAQMQAVEFGPLTYTMHGASLIFATDERVSYPLTKGVKHNIRLLARGNFLDVYVDDRLAHAYISRDPLLTSQIGFCAELATGDFINPTLWAMA